MTTEHAINALLDVALAVFPDGPQEIHDTEANSKSLKQAIEDILQGCEISLTSMMYDENRPPSKCKV